VALGFTYVVRTNLPPEAVTSIGVDIFLLWLSFAMGEDALNGKKLHYPSGRYASSISLKQVDATTVAIVADETIAPEAAILETGHRSFDMKTVTRLQGRALPMHRPTGGTEGAPGLRRRGASPASLRPSMWAELRGAEGSGFASFGPNSPAGSWIVPAMAAYSPGLTLAAMARKMAAGMGG
jgi:hypothetical protein